MRTVSVVLLCSLVTVATPASQATAEDGFKFPNLIPFKSKQTRPLRNKPDRPLNLPKLPPPPSLTLPDLPTLNMPKLELPKLGVTTKRNEPSTWTRLNRSTKNLFTKTKSALMSWGEKPSQGSPRRRGSQRVARQADKPSLMSNLFGTRSEKPEVDSVNDYLALPRPMP